MTILYMIYAINKRRCRNPHLMKTVKKRRKFYLRIYPLTIRDFMLENDVYLPS